jgi:hypothetical protein
MDGGTSGSSVADQGLTKRQDSRLSVVQDCAGGCCVVQVGQVFFLFFDLAVAEVEPTFRRSTGSGMSSEFKSILREVGEHPVGCH